jgi:hypothetical protein
MNPAQLFRRRAVPRMALAAAAVAGALLVTLVSPDAGHADAGHAGHDSAAASVTTPRQVAFHDAMRKLWEDHVTWTRLAIVAFADGSGDFDATAQRLLANQTDIGQAVAPFYGADDGARLTSLLHDHITIAVELMQAVKNGDDAAFADAKTRWYANANDIADFLSAANPRFWPDDVMRADMKTHLDQTLAEAADELGGNFTGSVQDYDAVHNHILAMADMLSSGIVHQFPQDFH